MIRYFFLFAFLQFARSLDNVPVFIWSNDRSVEFPSIIAGHHTHKSDFSNGYLKDINGHVILFTQEKLSLTDILVHGGVYGNSAKKSDYQQLKMAMTDYTATFLPNVGSPVDAILEIPTENKLFKIVKIAPQDLPTALSTVDLHEKSIIVIDFPPSSNTGTLENDQVVGEVVSYMKINNKQFTAFFTAKQSSESEKKSENENTRHLMSASSPEVKPVMKGNFMFYFRKLSVGDDLNQTVAIEDVEVVENNCNLFNSSYIEPSSNCSVVLMINNVNEYKQLNLSLLFVTSGKSNPNFWYVKETYLTYENNSKTERIRMNKGLVDPTPIGFSYSCSNPTPLSALGPSNVSVPVLRFSGFQIEVFMTNETKFGYYNDCIGFFTIGIWMFIICAAILISILLFGVIMLMGINTMDRYDDPKGKTISVAGGE